METGATLAASEPAARASAPVYGLYRLERVFGKTTPALREETIRFWRRNRVLLSENEGHDRSLQVFYVARNSNGEIAAVCTVYIADFQRAGNPHYFYRMFVQPADRTPGLAVFMCQQTGTALAADYAPGGPSGLMIVAENPSLELPGIRRLLEAGGYRNLGKDPRGCNLWLKPFVT